MNFSFNRFFFLSFRPRPHQVYIYTCALRIFIFRFSLTHLLGFHFFHLKPLNATMAFSYENMYHKYKEEKCIMKRNKKKDSNPELYIGVRASENFFHPLNSHKCSKEKFYLFFLFEKIIYFPFSQTSYTSHWIQFLFVSWKFHLKNFFFFCFDAICLKKFSCSTADGNGEFSIRIRV